MAMHLRITGDTASESGLGEVISWMSGPTRQHFLLRDYGGGLVGIGVVLMCQNERLNLRRRIRLSKKDKRLYMDIMLNLEQMRTAHPESRKKIVVELIKEEVPAVLRKYSIQDFDYTRFTDDLNTWLNGIILPEDGK